ncbi:MAG: MgtC/SapB family protein [Candidatus Aceula meridiana]|nr:MgtC/SapB family protein [Candidatus Aceula meridiana]
MIHEILDSSFWIKILFSMFCGFIIGVERQLRGKPVGIRTSILITMGSMVFITLAKELSSDGNPVRVLGQLVTGIGFLGAGVIMNKGGLVTGMTSAAVIWLLAGIGAAIGIQMYGVALIICFVCLFVLTGSQILEDVFKLLRRGVYERLKGDKGED